MALHKQWAETIAACRRMDSFMGRDTTEAEEEVASE